MAEGAQEIPPTEDSVDVSCFTKLNTCLALSLSRPC